MNHHIIRSTIGPLLLVICCPAIVMLMWYTNTRLGGSLSVLASQIENQGFFTLLYQIWWPYCFGSSTAWTIIVCFILFQYLLIRLLPGKTFYGPITPKGNIPQYQDNGFLAFIITVASFCFFSFNLHWFPATLIYDNFAAILGALNSLSLCLCLLLYFKGKYFPSTSDSGVTGNIIFDYYWGTELFPRFASINLKMFINCRLGMMSWGLIILSFAAKQQQLYGLSNAMMVAIILQFIYVGKFFIWETGYLASLDIMHDRAGYYICWGCLVWVPGIYTSPTLYLVQHPNHLPVWLALLFLGMGTASILINYLADRQRQMVRADAEHCKIWGKKPKLLLAQYTTETGEQKQSILLSSGWWGIARHFHYLPEIAGAFFWSAPALFDNFSPYFYTCFLTILLVDRSFRDDKRCREKYGQHWEAYCKQVPYRIIPYLL